MKLGKYRLQQLPRAWYLAIPKRWVETKGLDKGSVSEIFLDDQGNLLIKPFEEGENENR